MLNHFPQNKLDIWYVWKSPFNNIFCDNSRYTDTRFDFVGLLLGHYIYKCLEYILIIFWKYLQIFVLVSNQEMAILLVLVLFLLLIVLLWIVPTSRRRQILRHSHPDRNKPADMRTIRNKISWRLPSKPHWHAKRERVKKKEN